MACEQGNLFGPPEEHQTIFCPNSLSLCHNPFSLPSFHSLCLLAQALCNSNLFHSTFITSYLFTPPLLCFLFPTSSTHSPVESVPLTLPPYSNLYSTNPVLCSDFILLSVSLFLLPLPPPKSSKSLLHSPCLKSTLPPHHSRAASSLLYSNQESSCSVLPGPTRDLQQYKRCCLKPDSGITLKVMLSKLTTASVDRISGEASSEALTISQVYVKGSYFPKADNTVKIRQISILL